MSDNKRTFQKVAETLYNEAQQGRSDYKDGLEAGAKVGAAGGAATAGVAAAICGVASAVSGHVGRALDGSFGEEPKK